MNRTYAMPGALSSVASRGAATLREIEDLYLSLEAQRPARRFVAICVLRDEWPVLKAALERERALSEPMTILGQSFGGIPIRVCDTEDEIKAIAVDLKPDERIFYLTTKEPTPCPKD